MTPLQILLVLAAGIAAGAINTVVGSGTLVTFPTLVAFGVPPVSATMSNAVGLLPGNVAGTWGYRAELSGQRRRLRTLIPASMTGSVVGACLLLTLPARAFTAIVPVLLAVALLLVVGQPWLQRRMQRRQAGISADQPQAPVRPRTALLVALTFVTGVYGGYFAAAQGVLLIGIFGVMIPESLQRLNAAKNVLVLLVNLVSGTAYCLIAWQRIDWLATALIAAGSLVGGYIGAKVGRRLPPAVLRSVIVVLGLVAMWRILST